MSLSTVRTAVATALKTVTFDDGKKLRASAYLTEEVNTPQAFFDFEINHQIVLGSSQVCDYILVVQVLDQRDDARSAQIRLDQLRDPHDAGGLKQVLEDSSNWNGEVHFCEFQSCTAADVVNVAGVDYLSVEFRFGVTG